jgi:tRNA A37 threonylcarbamoyladenosine dehydratase
MARALPLDKPLHDGRFVRTERMLGREGMRRLSQARVAVIGLGAVGSYATEALARAGVGYLRLVDFDEVRLSNINRQLYALESTVGRRKVEIAAERVQQINPRCHTDPRPIFVHSDTLGEVLAEPLDAVIDAIDSFTPKLELLAALHRRDVLAISSMGAALRTDPSLLRVGPIAEVHHCPLAAKLRKGLRQRSIEPVLPCVYSTEPTHHLRREAIDPDPSANEDLLVRGRPRRTLGSLPTLTGIFGLTAANYILQRLASGKA